MGESIINACRGCKSRKLKQAMIINQKEFVICQTCTLLQRKENVLYNLTFDLSRGGIAVDYYPYFLTIKEFPKDDSVFYFSLKAIEAIVQAQGYIVTAAVTTNDGKLEVAIEKMSNLDRIRLYEIVKKLSSQFTYFLHSVKNK